MKIDGILVEMLRQKGFSYYDDRIKLVVDEWAINGGYDQENWYENLFGKLVLSNTISMKYQKLFDQLEKIIDEIELFGKNGILQKRIRERLKEQELDYTDETKLALDQSKANIGIKRFESLQAFLQDLWDDRDGYFQEGSKTQEGYEEGYAIGYEEGYDAAGKDEAGEDEFDLLDDQNDIVIKMLQDMYTDDFIIKTTGVSRRNLDFMKQILQGLRECENSEFTQYKFKSKTKVLKW